MSLFSDKDFFGDPLWPVESQSDKKKLAKLPSSQPKSNTKIQLDQRVCQSSYENEEPHMDLDNVLDLDHAYFLHEQKMLYTNFKHSEITYLDDFSKDNEFLKDRDIEKECGKLIENEPFVEAPKEQIKMDQDDEQSSLESLISSKEYSMEAQSENNFTLSNQKNITRKNRSITRSQYLLQKKWADKETRKNQLSSLAKYENKIIQQLLSKQCFFKEEQKKVKMLLVEHEIMKKLELPEEMNMELKRKKTKNKKKCLKYKILTKAEKQYLVYLSSFTTTCEVARRFNISVNNICRWKKGCERKVGAGRRITNQELEEKVIDYVKQLVRDGKVVTRKLVQTKAKELSDNKDFKASKGWFERFYNRNSNIFMCPD